MCRLYQQRYPTCQYLSHTMLYRIYKQLSMYGMFTETKKIENTNINNNNSLEVLCKLIENPHNSLRDISSNGRHILKFKLTILNKDLGIIFYSCS
jgi:hypothetical protein